MPRAFVVLDIDHTLLDNRGRLPDANRRAVAAALARYGLCDPVPFDPAAGCVPAAALRPRPATAEEHP